MKKILIITLTLAFSSLYAQKGRRIEILFLGDNGHHRPIERIPSLMAALGPKGINFTYTDKLEDLNTKTLNKYDALMIYANWDEIKPEQEKALLDYVASGKGLLPIHCASYCFRNSAEYVKLVGGQFWRHRMDSIRTETVQSNHPIMQGLKPFTAYDETYLHSQLQPDNNVLAVREIKADQFNDKPNTKTEPYTWTRTHGKGKIFYTAYGHDERTWNKEGFQDLIYNAILWTINDEALTAYKARNPKPFEYREAKLPNYEQRPGIQYQQLPLSPEESMKHIQVPVDFNLELFAAEPNVMHPIAMTWDEKGRLYVLITKDYPNERKPNGGSDYILLCEDTNKDGKADKFTRFAEGLSIPTGMVFANGGLIVSQAPDMLFLLDTDGDDKADVKKTLFTGFGTFDTHAGPSNLHYGFDNWIWGCVGYSGYKGKFGNADSLKFGQAFFRFKPDGSQMEWMTSTSNNTWGFAFNETNDVFGSTANNSHGWYMAIPHRYFNSANGVDNGSRSTDTHRDMKPITSKVRQVDAFGGFTAAAGHNFYTARAFPKKYWNKIAFVAEPTGHVLHQNNMVKKGTDYGDVESFNLMAGADEWFSPVFAEVGPDGAVWVADWYSFIIQHNPTPKGFTNGDGNAYETDLRDFTHGRIYRVSYKEAPEYKPIALSKNNANELLTNLKNDNMFWRMNAQRLIVERGQKDVVPRLIEYIKEQSIDQVGSNPAAIHSLWALKGLNALTTEIIEIALKHPSADVRKNGVLVMDNDANSVSLILKNKLLNDREPLVVLNSLLVFSKSPLNADAEKAFFDRMEKSDETNDRWLPDAFACVLTANGGKLMKKHLNNQIKKASITPKVSSTMNHDHHNMAGSSAQKTIEQPANGVDLVISNIKVEPSNPAVRERITFTIEVKNQGNKDLDSGIVVPIDVRIDGMGMKVEQISRNHKEGIKSGETVSITRFMNGPWVSNFGFSTDIAGEYSISASLDKDNSITEGNDKNNFSSKKVTFTPPQNMNAYVLERALRSYASVATVDSLVSIIRKSQVFDAQGQYSVYKAISEGWNYRLKNVAVNPADKTYLLALNTKANNERLTRFLKAWNVIEEKKAEGDVKVIRIKSVREAMKFDIKEFTVKAGQTVEIIFENPDAMQHNIVFVQPKAIEKVGLAADKMMMDEKGAEKNYVPALAEVIASSPLVNPDQTYRFTFKAPSTIGNYPYVCTFPGHWRLMNGMMKVVK
ncbi:MAG: ThuA domain-containing protein [Spirosomaceae bacterium]|jgi:putative membrane-bound dehydrogenase-like protein|nr:ThuA domain-containing protein [Spirosomataceae bacterium]